MFLPTEYWLIKHGILACFPVESDNNCQMSLPFAPPVISVIVGEKGCFCDSTPLTKNFITNYMVRFLQKGINKTHVCLRSDEMLRYGQIEMGCRGCTKDMERNIPEI